MSNVSWPRMPTPRRRRHGTLIPHFVVPLAHENGGQNNWPPFREIRIGSSLSSEGLLVLLRLLTTLFFELRQLINELLRGLLECAWAIRAAEVNLLAFVFDRVLWIDRLAAHRAHR